MTEKSRNYKILVISSVRNYRDEILQEFLLLADELKSELVRFCEAGVDAEKRIAFKEYAPENAKHRGYIVVEEEKTKNMVSIISTINRSNGCAIYKRFTANLSGTDYLFLNRFSAFAELDELYTVFRYAQKALDLLSYEE